MGGKMRILIKITIPISPVVCTKNFCGGEVFPTIREGISFLTGEEIP